MLIPVFLGCDTSEDLGIQYDLGGEANVRFVEFTLPTTSIYIDSLRTDAGSRVLTGQYNDQLTGDVVAEGYFQFSYEQGPLPRSGEDNTDTLKLDSLILTLEANQIIPISGNSMQAFDIYELTNELESGAIYLASSQQTKSNQIGSFSGEINTLLDTIYRIKLDETYAQTLFNELSIIAGDDGRNIASESFLPLGLIGGANAMSVASFDLANDTARIIMYSSPTNAESQDTTYLTRFSLNGKSYSFLDRDFSDENFGEIDNNQDFNLAENKTVIDPLLGINTAFSIEQLDQFFSENPRILINSASISFSFDNEIKRDTLENFIPFFRKANGGIFGPGLVSNSFENVVMTDGAYLSFTPDPATSFLNVSNDEILINSTLFFQQLYRQYTDSGSLQFSVSTTGNTVPVEELVLISPIDVTLQRTIFKEDGVKLRIYYTQVDQ